MTSIHPHAESRGSEQPPSYSQVYPQPVPTSAIYRRPGSNVYNNQATNTFQLDINPASYSSFDSAEPTNTALRRSSPGCSRPAKPSRAPSTGLTVVPPARNTATRIHPGQVAAPAAERHPRFSDENDTILPIPPRSSFTGQAFHWPIMTTSSLRFKITKPRGPVGRFNFTGPTESFTLGPPVADISPYQAIFMSTKSGSQLTIINPSKGEFVITNNGDNEADLPINDKTGQVQKDGPVVAAISSITMNRNRWQAGDHKFRFTVGAVNYSWKYVGHGSWVLMRNPEKRIIASVQANGWFGREYLEVYSSKDLPLNWLVATVAVCLVWDKAR